jgi:DUF4097 and DUF4098 domain-containing protein YvlB
MGLLLSCMVGAAHAGEAVDKTLAVKSDGLVRIENVRGRIEVQGWERSDVMVTGTLDDLATSFTFETSAATTTVKVETPNNLNHGKGSDLVIRVPMQSRVRVDLVSADLTMRDLQGSVDGKTVSGEINARDLSGTTLLATVSGDIDVMQVGGPATFNSVSGDIKAETDAEQIKIATVSGDAEVRAGKQLKELTLNSISGNLDANADLADGARVKGSTTSGDIRLTLNPDTSAVVDLRTGSGRIKNALTGDRPKRAMSGGEELDVTIGGGTGVIELTTISGTLELGVR